MNGDAAVRIEALWKRYGHRTALGGVDLTLEKGSCVAILGPNGAGKSTLLRVVATRVRPTSGRVEVLGRDIVRRPLEARHEIGVVFHESCLRADLTLDQNLRFFSSLYSRHAERAVVESLLERLGLAERRGDPVRGFSRGMVQRATLIRSLLHDPALWLLDEPFTGLDPEGQALLEQLIESEVAGGRTVVFVTHDIEVGLRLAHDAVVIDRGDVAARGKEAVEGFFRSASERS